MITPNHMEMITMGTTEDLATKYAAEIAAYEAKEAAKYAKKGRFGKWLADSVAKAEAARQAELERTRGWSQIVETGADVHKRVTATRLVATGVFAFAFKKTAGHVYLVTLDAGGTIVASEEHKAKDERKLRAQAAAYNRAHREC